jgi:hypothetical protein
VSEGDIQLKISTALDASGLDGASRKLESFRGGVGKSARAFRSFAEKIGGDAGMASAALGLIAKAGAEMLRGGIWAAGAEVLATGLNLAVGHIREAREKARELRDEFLRAAEAAARAFDEGRLRAMKDSLAAASRHSEALAKNFDAAALAAEKLAAARVATEIASGGAAAAQMRRDKAEAVGAASDGQEKKAVAADWDIKIAEAASAAAVKAAERGLAAAKGSVEKHEEESRRAGVNYLSLGDASRRSDKDLSVARVDAFRANQRLATVKEGKAKGVFDDGDLGSAEREAEREGKALQEVEAARKNIKDALVAQRENMERLDAERKAVEEAVNTATAKLSEARETAAAEEVEARNARSAVHAAYVAAVKAEEKAVREKSATEAKLRDVSAAREARQDLEGRAVGAKAEAREARKNTAQAWGWYRNRDSLRAQMREEKEEARAQKQFDEDYKKLERRRPNWREAANLNIGEEATKRVALAREGEDRADKSLVAIEGHARETKEMLRALLEAK